MAIRMTGEYSEPRPELGLTRPIKLSEVKYEPIVWGTDNTRFDAAFNRLVPVYQSCFQLRLAQTVREVQFTTRLDYSNPPSRCAVIATYRGKDVGFCIQERVDVDVNGSGARTVLFTHARAVDQKYQQAAKSALNGAGQHGIGTCLFLTGVSALTQEGRIKIDYFGGRTQKEPVIYGLARTGLTHIITPFGEFDETGMLKDPQKTGSNRGREYRGILRKVLTHLATRVAIYIGETDYTTGLVVRAYPEGATEGTEVDLSRPQLMAIHRRFEELGLNDGTKTLGYTVNYLAQRDEAVDNMQAFIEKLLK